MLTIARALMMKPRLLILDEPTLGLAPVILEPASAAKRSGGPSQTTRACSST
jgi:ABC-type branched-subunit amino acid transport system ATPase component